MKNIIKRPGIDQDPVQPWNWATLAGQSDPVEIVSYPFPCEDGVDKVMVRMKVGDPTSIREVEMVAIAAFAPSRHEWFNREKIYYGGTTTDFYFVDELYQDSLERIRKREKQ